MSDSHSVESEPIALRLHRAEALLREALELIADRKDCAAPPARPEELSVKAAIRLVAERRGGRAPTERTIRRWIARHDVGGRDGSGALVVFRSRLENFLATPCEPRAEFVRETPNMSADFDVERAHDSSNGGDSRGFSR